MNKQVIRRMVIASLALSAVMLGYSQRASADDRMGTARQDRPGMSYEWFQTQSYDVVACWRACASDVRCRSWSYGYQPGFTYAGDPQRTYEAAVNKCALKSGIPEPSYARYLRSGVKPPPPAVSGGGYRPLIPQKGEYEGGPPPPVVKR